MAEGNSFNATFGSAGGGGSTEIVWGSITGTLSNQTDLQNALDDKQDTLVSGTNIKTINGTTLLGSGDVETASVNPSSTFLPINTSGEFTDSPFYTLYPPANFGGFGGIGTKSYIYSTPPPNIPDYNDFGLEIKSYFEATTDSSVSLGDYAQSVSPDTGEFYWYTGQRLNGSDNSGFPNSFLPSDTSGIIFNTNNYDLLNITREFIKIDAKGGNPALVDGILYNKGIGMIGFGSGLNADFINNNSNESALFWNFNALSFTINSAQGQRIFRNDSWARTYISVNDSIGVEYTLGVTVF